MSEMGQNAKYPLRTNVFRYAPMNGHRQFEPSGQKSANKRHQSITSSARASNDSEIASPMSLAALLLITSSNFVG
jgi:hypothetical protein